MQLFLEKVSKMENSVDPDQTVPLIALDKMLYATKKY